MEGKNNAIVTEIEEKQTGSSKNRYMAYLQTMKKLERKAQMEKEKKGAKA